MQSYVKGVSCSLQHKLGCAGSSQPSYVVFGRRADLFDEPETAAYFDAGSHLIPWSGDQEARTDRYDVRLLLERLPPFIDSRSVSSRGHVYFFFAEAHALWLKGCRFAGAHPRCWTATAIQKSWMRSATEIC